MNYIKILETGGLFKKAKVVLAYDDTENDIATLPLENGKPVEVKPYGCNHYTCQPWLLPSSRHHYGFGQYAGRQDLRQPGGKNQSIPALGR